MDCRSCMSPISTLLYGDDPAGVTIDFMRRHHMEWVPIVDREQIYIGLISTEKLMRMLLPKSIGMMRGVRHASYLRESPQDLDQRMQTIRDMSTRELIDSYAKTVHPDAALADALMVISKSQYVVPVVDDAGHLLGVISYFSIMHEVEQQLAQQHEPS